MKKKRRVGEHDETRRRLEQAMAALEHHRGVSPELDANVRETVERFGRRNLEAALRHFVQSGDTEHAAMLADMLERAKRLSKKDSKKRKRGESGE